MDGPALDNANPTLLSLDQLPSRQRKRAAAGSNGPETRFDHILSLKHSSAPLDLSSSLWPSSDEDERESELTEEPIDEQEIYGMFLFSQQFLYRLATLRLISSSLMRHSRKLVRLTPAL